MKVNFTILCLFLILHALALKSQDLEGYVVQDPSNGVNRYNQALTDALMMQLKADSFTRMARDKRILAREIPDETMKVELAGDALQYENEAKRIQAEASRLFDLAREIRGSGQSVTNNPDGGLSLVKTINGIRVYEYNLEPESPEGPAGTDLAKEPASPDEPANPDEHTSPDEPANPDEHTSPDEPARPDEPTGTDLVKETDIIFDILERSPYGEENPYPLLMKEEAGLVYRIQLIALGSPAAFDAFSGIVPVFVEVTGRNDLFKYYAGRFTDLQSVTRALEQIRAKGFFDAFVVAFFEGRQITTEEARKIEFAEFKL